FQQVRFERFGCGGQPIPSPHGTAVAALLVTQNSVAEIFSADVYCGNQAGGAVDSVAAALAWLARERVAVINISLVGPRNALLERSVNSLVARGFLIVAAVGNDGPAAPPLYPASYAGVVGVSALDAVAPVRGTSFAAPLVAGLMATDLVTPDVAQRERTLEKWAQAANDLG